MTQVWMVRNSDTDIHLFNRYEHLEPSVKTSFSRCRDVVVTEKREAKQTSFHVSFVRDGIPCEETITAICLPVWTEPSHL